MDEQIDARKLPREVLEEKRRQARKLGSRGVARKEIGDILGVHADSVGRWLKLASRDLKVNRGGCRAGEARNLTSSQERALRQMIAEQAPDQFKMPYALWTRRAAMELIERETGAQLVSI